MNEQESKRILEESLKAFAKKPIEDEETPTETTKVQEFLEEESTPEEVDFKHLTNKKPLFIGIGFVLVVLVAIATSIFYYGFLPEENPPNSQEIASQKIDKILTPAKKDNANQIQKETFDENMKSEKQESVKPEIVPESKEKFTSKNKSYTEEIISVVETWEKSWENGNFDTFINLYSKDFNSDGMNYESWSKKKSRSLKNKAIQIGVSDLRIIKQENVLIVTFIQNYKSKTISDLGEKTMKFKQENGSYKIFSEKWKKIR